MPAFGFNLVSGSPVNAITGGVSLSPGVGSTITQGTPGGPATVSTVVMPGNPVAAITYPASGSAAVLQTKELTGINFAAVGDEWEATLGQIAYLLDLSGTPVAVDTIKVSGPGGLYFDLAAFTVLKTSTVMPPGLPPGKYRFQNVSAGAITAKVVMAVQLDS